MIKLKSLRTCTSSVWCGVPAACWSIELVHEMICCAVSFPNPGARATDSYRTLYTYVCPPRQCICICTSTSGADVEVDKQMVLALDTGPDDASGLHHGRSDQPWPPVVVGGSPAPAKFILWQPQPPPPPPDIQWRVVGLGAATAWRGARKERGARLCFRCLMLWRFFP